MSDVRTEMVESFDGAPLAVHRLGAGRPVLMLHGLFSSAQMNWIRFGHAARLAEAGFEAIMPDLRAHGQSAAPHEPSSFPRDVLVRDVRAVVDAAGLEDFDLVGFSLGARTAARAVISGLAPRKLVLAGMGLEGLAGWEGRAAFFIDAIDRFAEVKQGDPAYMAVQFMKTMKIDRVAARLLLQSVDDTSKEDLVAITMPTLVLCGDKDRDNGSPQKLAEALPNGRFEEIPGTHMGSVTEPDLGLAITRYLAG
ncbi:alpha/beta fold hydrolase [Altererythrobacter sp. Root672]|uniref:alpha/beta fold hydrolase n=1 Tax=Altererythrobacter sp. Root672 TaxID=1736584 RepID=UPI000701B2D2|nr:alpha/beta fold hydrolase [Altererythrobacter sp. Root672]KRA83121.1 hydrolase [Altererythrobacter sp. Root672]